MNITAETLTRKRIVTTTVLEEAVTLTLTPNQASQLWQVLNHVSGEGMDDFPIREVRGEKYGYGETVRRIKRAIESIVNVQSDTVNYHKETTDG